METKNKVQNEEKENKTKTNFAKSKIAIAALVVLGVLIGWEIGIRAYVSYIRPYFSGMAYRNAVDAYIQLHLNDFVGGDTPEQTVDLFIKALKEGDYELASKYFVIDEQEKWKKDLQELTKEQVDAWVGKIEENKKNWHKEQQDENKFEFWYNTGEGENEITHSIIFKKNMNNKWKIVGF